MRQTIKGTRYSLLTRAANLEKEKLPKLEDALLALSQDQTRRMIAFSVTLQPES